jgi:hypothetical protein
MLRNEINSETDVLLFFLLKLVSVSLLLLFLLAVLDALGGPHFAALPA